MAKLTDETRATLRRRSRLANLGRDTELSQGFVNVPPFRGSTVLYPDVGTLKKGGQRFTYGRRGTPTMLWEPCSFRRASPRSRPRSWRRLAPAITCS
jgi:hypothetical protein